MKNIIVSVAMFVVMAPAMACGGYTPYPAEELRTFRLLGSYENDAKWFEHNDVEDPQIANLEAWAKLTSTKIPLDDIRQVVYKWPLAKLQEMSDDLSHFKTDNAFARWIVKHNDREIVDLLLTAKLCESTREETYTEWYYFYEGDELSDRLREVVRRAEAYQGTRLADRYWLQEMRAYKSLHHNDSIIAVWNRAAHNMQKGYIRVLTADYVAGAYRTMDDTDRYRELTATEHNYAVSVRDTIGKGVWAYFDWVYSHDPDARYLLEEMQQRVWRSELYDTWNAESWDSWEATYSPWKLLDRVKLLIADQRTQRMEYWYYTGAYLADACGKMDLANEYVNKAYSLARPGFLKDVIRIQRMLTRVKSAKQYDASLEKFLYTELQWLDKQMRVRLDETTRKDYIDNGTSYVCYNFSRYYWGDMMRKLLTGRVAPLCMASNQPLKALQYLNMSDNNLLQIVNEQYCWEYSENVSLEEYRSLPGHFNYLDYSTDHFEMLDTLDIAVLIEYRNLMASPKSAVDRFLFTHGYTDLQYLDDIIGTKLMLEMKYKEAIPYLKRLSVKFIQSRNVYEYCGWDPFTGRKDSTIADNYKLRFAQNMVELEGRMQQSADPNEIAEAKIEYLMAMRHSVEFRCWPLTRFAYSDVDSYLDKNRDEKLLSRPERLRIALRDSADALEKEAMSGFTDPERAAKGYYRLCKFKSLVTQFPNTEMAEYVKGHCDKLYDY